MKSCKNCEIAMCSQKIYDISTACENWIGWFNITEDGYPKDTGEYLTKDKDGVIRILSYDKIFKKFCKTQYDSIPNIGTIVSWRNLPK